VCSQFDRVGCSTISKRERERESGNKKICIPFFGKKKLETQLGAAYEFESRASATEVKKVATGVAHDLCPRNFRGGFISCSVLDVKKPKR